jgi:hypothetical protein
MTLSTLGRVKLAAQVVAARLNGDDDLIAAIRAEPGHDQLDLEIGLVGLACGLAIELAAHLPGAAAENDPRAASRLLDDFLLHASSWRDLGDAG